MKLVPFAKITSAQLQCEFTAKLIGRDLTASFLLKGEIEKILHLSDSKAASIRKPNLWENTCFEWFLRNSESSKYWEANFAADGSWNFYSLSDYRKNLQEEVLSTPPKMSREHKSSQCQLTFTLPLPPEISLPQKTISALAINPAAVVVLKTGEKTYWAGKHTQEKPDFHHHLNFFPFSECEV